MQSKIKKNCFSSDFWGGRRTALMLTYPQCDIQKEKLIELFKSNSICKSHGIQYIIVCEEKHKDGSPHNHVYLQFKENVNITRKDCQEGFDLIKEYNKGSGFELEDKDIEEDWSWAREMALEMNIEEIKGGKEYIQKNPYEWVDVETEEGGRLWIEGHTCFLRRYHCNIRSVKGKKGAMWYVKKNGNYITQGITTVIESMDKKEMNKMLIEEDIIELIDDGQISLYNLDKIMKARELYKSLQNERAIKGRRNKLDKKLHWFYGPTGTGKSYTAWKEAIEKYGEDQVWRAKTNGVWYDGYIGQKAVIIDDIRAATWHFSDILQITDKFDLQVPVKGGFRQWIPLEIWITAPAEPKDIYKNYTTGEPYEGIDQLERRISDLRLFDERYDSQETLPSQGEREGQAAKTQWDED